MAGSGPVIWKTAFPITDETVAQLPAGARPLRVGMQGGSLCMWFLCDPSTVTYDCRVRIIGTGNPTPDDLAALSEAVVALVFTLDPTDGG